MSRLFFIALVVLSFAFNSCRNDVYSPDACFNPNIKAIIVSNCTRSGCHNPVDREHHLDLTNYNGIMKIVNPGHPLQSDLYTSITGSGEESMPPDHKLTKHEITLIKSWIAFGAKESNCVGQSCDSVYVTYSGQVTSILNSNCIGCHAAGTAIPLDNYNAVAAQVSSGKLLAAVKRTGPLPMPPSYSLSQCDIRVIEKWIANGAPNN